MKSKTDYKRLWKREKKERIRFANEAQRLEGIIGEQADIIKGIKEGRIKIDGK